MFGMQIHIDNTLPMELSNVRFLYKNGINILAETEKKIKKRKKMIIAITLKSLGILHDPTIAKCHVFLTEAVSRPKRNS